VSVFPATDFCISHVPDVIYIKAVELLNMTLRTEL
jgi:hypothetical protein